MSKLSIFQLYLPIFIRIFQARKTAWMGTDEELIYSIMEDPDFIDEVNVSLSKNNYPEIFSKIK